MINLYKAYYLVLCSYVKKDCFVFYFLGQTLLAHTVFYPALSPKGGGKQNQRGGNNNNNRQQYT